jgi:hypothetical protein
MHLLNDADNKLSTTNGSHGQVRLLHDLKIPGRAFTTEGPCGNACRGIHLF